jgi:hypothetical protein
MEQECIIYNSNERYARKLLETLLRKKTIGMTFHLFTDKDQLERYITDRTIHFLIIGEDCSVDVSILKQVTNLLVLTEEQKSTEVLIETYGRPCVGICRYQSGENIVNAIMKMNGSVDKDAINNTEIIGVYSPLQIDHTVFSLSLAKAYAESKRTLYINFEEFAGICELLPSIDGVTLSDAIYLFRQSEESVDHRVMSTIHSHAGIDYFAPVQCAEDITFIHLDQMERFIRAVAKQCGYEVVLIDISSAVRQQWKLMELCHKVYMPVLSDYISQKRISVFETYLLSSGMESIFDRIEKVSIPADEDTDYKVFWEKMQFGGMYKYVRQYCV